MKAIRILIVFAMLIILVPRPVQNLVVQENCIYLQVAPPMILCDTGTQYDILWTGETK